MNFTLEGITIADLAYAEPPEVVSSADIEARLEPLYSRLRLPTGRLELMTGIRERRFWPQGCLPSMASAKAAEAVLAKTGEDRSGIDLLIHCGVCRDRLEPATASNVHRLLGLSQDCQIFDVSNACLGMLNGFAVAAGMLRSGQARRALVVSGENGRPLLERTLRTLLEEDLSRNAIKPYFANLTIGGGAMAAVLCRDEDAQSGSIRLGKGSVMSDSSANELCQGDSAGDELAMMTDSEALLVAGVAIAQRSWDAFRESTGWTAETPARVLTHQVGRRHQLALFQALGIPQEKDYSTYATWGNVGSVSLPLTLTKAIEDKAIVSGDNVALLGIGSGLVCMMLSGEVL